jgi:hypothetical protein
MKSVKLQGVIELFQFEFSSEISNVYLNLNCTDFIKIKFLFAMVFIGKRSIGKTRLWAELSYAIKFVLLQNFLFLILQNYVFETRSLLLDLKKVSTAN